MQWIWLVARWVLGVGVAYLVLASGVLALGLGLLFTAGAVDWSGRQKPAPADPLAIGFRGDPLTALGYAFETVRYPTELGPAEAWLVPAAAPAELWAVYVHGIGGLRENGYRLLQTLHEAGVPVLLISYRNDDAAPRAADRLHSFGLSEWRDLEAAIGWTGREGAEKVVIVAESMGAAIAGQYLQRSADSSLVAGLAFDAPALDLPALVRASAARYWLPLSDVVVAAGLWASSWLRRDLREAVSIEAVAGFDGPIFVAHGTRDPLVPYSISARLVALRDDVVLVETAAEQHLHSFESDRAAYAAALRRWLEQVRAEIAGRPSAQGAEGQDWQGDGGEDDGQQVDGGVEGIDQQV